MLQTSAKNIITCILVLYFLWVCTNFISFSAASSLLVLFEIIFKSLTPVSGPLAGVMIGLLPTTLYLCKKFLNLNDIDIDKDIRQYVVCQKCCSLYELEEHNGTYTLKRCCDIPFPSHRDKSLILSVKALLNCKGIKDKLMHWQRRNVPDNLLADVYDGWKEFKRNGYFTTPGDLAFMLNIDWFQPFKHTADSLRAIYLAILNLPREECYKRENMLLVGLLPVMEKEQSDLTPF